MCEELKTILAKFAESGWDLIDKPAKDYLCGVDNRTELIKAIEQANEQCGSCGCEFDPLYKRALELLQTR
jgi:sugar phosphate isomerase/epimerase